VGAYYDDRHVVITFTIEHKTRYCNARVHFLLLDVTPIHMMYQEELLHVALVK